jgi:hypothetical protein
LSKKNDLRIREEAGRQIAFEEAGVHICRRLEREREGFLERKREKVVAYGSCSFTKLQDQFLFS